MKGYRKRRIYYELRCDTNGLWYVAKLRKWLIWDDTPKGLSRTNIQRTNTIKSAMRMINRYSEHKFILTRHFYKHGKHMERDFIFDAAI